MARSLKVSKCELAVEWICTVVKSYDGSAGHVEDERYSVCVSDDSNQEIKIPQRTADTYS